MSYADLWTLAGATAIEEMGGPSIPWRGGRSDSNKPTTVPDGRLPAADSGCVAADVKHLRDIFHRMGFDDREIVCLAGAHAVGRCHEVRVETCARGHTLQLARLCFFPHHCCCGALYRTRPVTGDPGPMPRPPSPTSTSAC